LPRRAAHRLILHRGNDMSLSNGRAANPLDMRERVDELATRLALSGANKKLVADLIAFCEAARDDGFSRMTEVISRLSVSVKGVSKGTALEELLGREIPLVQQVLDAGRDGGSGAGSASAPGEGGSAEEPLSIAEDAEMVVAFIVESREHLTTIEQQMLLIEQNTADSDSINTVFRGFHTMKGLAGFLEFSDIQEVAHEVETLLGLARNSSLTITPEIVDVVLESADFVKQALGSIEDSLASGGHRIRSNGAALVAKIRAAMGGASEKVQPAERTQSVERSQSAEMAEPVQAPQDSAGAAASDLPAATERGVSSPLAESKASKARDTSSLRVDTEKLDHLVEMVGEMVIAQSLIRHDQSVSLAQDSRLLRNLSQLARITNDVQRTTMSLRMVPMGQIFQRTARVARDLSRKTGKQIELETSGDETEVDKIIAEELADPLMHMVRNAVDHGIEPPEARVAAGKKPTAQIRLSAYHQGGQIAVEIADDGRGLDREKILSKARKNGLVSRDAQLTENEIFHLIFEPGFSTAEQITDISGRGVGMDVVRKQLQKLRGRIEIQSQPGRGTTFCLKLPLTLAIIEGLAVRVGGQRYIVPIFSVIEIVKPTQEMLSTVRGKNEMAMVRGRLLPIVRLHRQFRVEPSSENFADGLLVVVESQGRQFALFVDDLAGKQEVVIKSLGDDLKNVSGIAGGAILGDGRVGLILDVEGIFLGGRQ